MSSTATTPAISFDTIVEMHILANDLAENTPVITDDQLFREDVTSAIEAKIREANWPSTITLEVPKDHPQWNEDLQEFLYESFADHYRTPDGESVELKVVIA